MPLTEDLIGDLANAQFAWTTVDNNSHGEMRVEDLVTQFGNPHGILFVYTHGSINNLMLESFPTSADSTDRVLRELQIEANLSIPSSDVLRTSYNIGEEEHWAISISDARIGEWHSGSRSVLWLAASYAGDLTAADEAKVVFGYTYAPEISTHDGYMSKFLRMLVGKALYDPGDPRVVRSVQRANLNLDEDIGFGWRVQGDPPILYQHDPGWDGVLNPAVYKFETDALDFPGGSGVVTWEFDCEMNTSSTSDLVTGGAVVIDGLSWDDAYTLRASVSNVNYGSNCVTLNPTALKSAAHGFAVLDGNTDPPGIARPMLSGALGECSHWRRSRSERCR